ncbi:MAG: hypothetical protein ACRDZO_06045, partial [Egibacteraceae bacterium]
RGAAATQRSFAARGGGKDPAASRCPLASTPAADRRAAPVRALRQALGFSISVVTAASGDFALLDQLVRSPDPDLIWVARENLKKARLARWPDKVAALQASQKIRSGGT